MSISISNSVVSCLRFLRCLRLASDFLLLRGIDAERRLVFSLVVSPQGADDNAAEFEGSDGPFDDKTRFFPLAKRRLSQRMVAGQRRPTYPVEMMTLQSPNHWTRLDARRPCEIQSGTSLSDRSWARRRPVPVCGDASTLSSPDFSGTTMTRRVLHCGGLLRPLARPRPWHKNPSRFCTA